MAQCHGVVFESLMVDCDAIWSADSILTPVAFADRIFFVHLTSEVKPETVLNISCLFRQTVLLYEREYSTLYRSQSRREV